MNAAAPQPVRQEAPHRSEVNFRQQFEYALQYKDDGNVKFKEGDMRGALECYHRSNMYVKVLLPYGNDPAASGFIGALGSQLGRTEQRPSDEIVLKTRCLAVMLYQNMATAHLLRKDMEVKPDRVIDLCSKAIEIDTNALKARVKRGQAYLLKNDAPKARLDLEKAIGMDPNSKAVQVLMRKLEALEAKDEKKEKKMYANMFGNTPSAKLSGGRAVGGPKRSNDDPPDNYDGDDAMMS